jgi:hypothetical protein
MVVRRREVVVVEERQRGKKKQEEERREEKKRKEGKRYQLKTREEREASIAFGSGIVEHRWPMVSSDNTMAQQAHTKQPQCEIGLPWQRSERNMSQDNHILTNQVAALVSPDKMEGRVGSSKERRAAWTDPILTFARLL